MFLGKHFPFDPVSVRLTRAQQRPWGARGHTSAQMQNPGQATNGTWWPSPPGHPRARVRADGEGGLRELRHLREKHESLGDGHAPRPSEERTPSAPPAQGSWEALHTVLASRPSHVSPSAAGSFCSSLFHSQQERASPGPATRRRPGLSRWPCPPRPPSLPARGSRSASGLRRDLGACLPLSDVPCLVCHMGY